MYLKIRISGLTLICWGNIHNPGRCSHLCYLYQVIWTGNKSQHCHGHCWRSLLLLISSLLLFLMYTPLCSFCNQHLPAFSANTCDTPTGMFLHYLSASQLQACCLCLTPAAPLLICLQYTSRNVFVVCQIVVCVSACFCFLDFCLCTSDLIIWSLGFAPKWTVFCFAWTLK